MISVIVPALNEEDQIEACLKALENQSLAREKYEVIVVDGGSEDATAERALNYADRVVSQKCLGIGGARRDGAYAASGEILAFTDADTVVSNRWLEVISGNLEGFDASTGPVVYQDPDLGAELLWKWRQIYRFLAISNFYYIIGSNMAVRSRAYFNIGGHSEISLLDDYDLSRKLFSCGYRSTYDSDQVVYTSPRRTEKILTYALTVAYGHYHYSISKERERLLHYPKPEEMKLVSLLPSERGRDLISSAELLQSSLENKLRRLFG
jgi:glycosyltransferase involved in cell wall biosynthesis